MKIEGVLPIPLCTKDTLWQSINKKGYECKWRWETTVSKIIHSTNSWKGSALCIVWLTSNKYFISPLVHLVQHFVLPENYFKRVLYQCLGTNGMICCIAYEFLQTSSDSILMYWGTLGMTFCIICEFLQKSSDSMLMYLDKTSCDIVYCPWITSNE